MAKLHANPAFEAKRYFDLFKAVVCVYSIRYVRRRKNQQDLFHSTRALCLMRICLLPEQLADEKLARPLPRHAFYLQTIKLYIRRPILTSFVILDFYKKAMRFENIFLIITDTSYRRIQPLSLQFILKNAHVIKN